MAQLHILLLGIYLKDCQLTYQRYLYIKICCIIILLAMGLRWMPNS